MNPAQLLVYGFAPGAEFEGRLVGASERIESGGTCESSTTPSSRCSPTAHSSRSSSRW
jgi:hypothetical protein